MIEQWRLAEEFSKLVEIDSLSLGEREMADYLRRRLEALGLEVYEDNAGEQLGGSSGNLIALLRGRPEKPSVLLSAHMDTVAPGCGKKAQLKDGVFYSDGTTVLGADNAAAIAIILEALRIVEEENLSHGDITVAFSVAEELALLGSNRMDFSRIHAEYGIVLDCAGKPGTAVLRAPVHYDMDVTIRGKAAHSGIEPEKGVNAVKVAAEAVAGMKIGRISPNTTANIGMINGGSARNTVCDFVELKCEARSLKEQELAEQLEHMEKCFRDAAARYGAEVTVNSYIKYPVLDVGEDSRIVGAFREAAGRCGTEADFVSTGGGSDANVFAGRGIEILNMAIGMEEIHTTRERIALADMEKSTEILLEMLKILND